ncbi:MAG: hypothetical protein K6A62_08865 [Bacteroidales bacterium]|nr:hypothetical protein [Bacteroidales bacterium]
MKKVLTLSLIILLSSILSGCSKFDMFIRGLDGEIVAPSSRGGLPESEELWALITGYFYAGHENDDNYLVQDSVAVINDKSQLGDVIFRGKTYSWPEVDLRRRSLVIGMITVPDGGGYIAGQRIEKKDNKLLLYPDIRSVGGTMMPERRFFATFYPKLPDLPVEIVRWYLIGP